MFLNILIFWLRLFVNALTLGKANVENIGSPKTLATGLFGTTYSILLYKIRENKEIDIKTLYNEYANIIFAKYE